jgi:hypothetical protein
MALIVALSLAIVPPTLFRDAPDCAISTGALLTQSATVTPFVGRPGDAGSPQRGAAPIFSHRQVPPEAHRAHTGRPCRELTFGGVTASVMPLYLRFLVYLI